MASAPLMLLPVLTLILWAIGLIDVPWGWGFTFFALLSPVFIPLPQQFGLHSVLVSVAFIAAGNSFFMGYHQPCIIMSNRMTKSKAWSEGQVSMAGLLHAISIVVGIFVSSFCWKAMGLMP